MSLDENVEYRKIERFPDYLFGDDGSIWTICNRGKYPVNFFRKLKTRQYHENSFYQKILTVNKKKIYIVVHEIIYEAFNGNIDKANNIICYHKDGNKENNALSNLDVKRSELIQTNIEYKKIERYRDYLFGSDGSVISYRRLKSPIQIKPFITKANYCKITIFDNDGKKQCPQLHCLICEAFYGPRPTNMTVSHLDGNGLNNNSSNLKWESLQDNIVRQFEHGTTMRGEKNHKAKLKNNEVLEIIDYLNQNISIKELSIKYNTSFNVIYSIKCGKTWGWLTGRKIKNE